MAGAQTRTGVGTLMRRACIGYFQRRCLLPHSSPQPHNALPSLMYFKKHYESMCNPWWQLDSPRRAAYADMQFVKAFQVHSFDLCLGVEYPLWVGEKAKESSSQ
jgi:hypothetical protein